DDGAASAGRLRAPGPSPGADVAGLRCRRAVRPHLARAGPTSWQQRPQPGADAQRGGGAAAGCGLEAVRAPVDRRPGGDHAMTFAQIRDKVRAQEPLSFEDGVALYQHPNLMEVGALANEVRERLHGDRTYFNRNFHINATNVCVASCMF